MLVCGQNFTDEIIRKISKTVECEPEISRRGLSLRVCQWLDWKGPNGKPKDMSCRVALLKLHRQDIIKLPECKDQGAFQPKKGKVNQSVEETKPVNCNLKDLGCIELIRVGSRQSKAGFKTAF